MLKNNISSRLLDVKSIDKTWTLFLDRDGVINEEVVGEYVLSWDGFLFSKGALEAYLPNGYKSKDMEKLIQLVSDENILQVLPQDELSELKGIIDNIQK